MFGHSEEQVGPYARGFVHTQTPSPLREKPSSQRQVPFPANPPAQCSLRGHTGQVREQSTLYIPGLQSQSTDTIGRVKPGLHVHVPLVESTAAVPLNPPQNALIKLHPGQICEQVSPTPIDPTGQSHPHPPPASVLLTSAAFIQVRFPVPSHPLSQTACCVGLSDVQAVQLGP